MVNKIREQAFAMRREVASGNLPALIARYGDLILVAAVAAMVGMMIVPLPTFLLDILLTVNITGAVTILMVSIYVSNGTEIASYPTLLLITTLYRLSLDISATRLILLQANAGEVIRSFGEFVVQGNFVVGAVIFLIITLVQFIVITKGAERVAEVSARFTLDAMPGKQMSIDADMRAGIIDFETARMRRESLSRESQFYGAMDGAMKFVKGDAIAGIIITLINIIGGLIIGIAMHGMSASEAVQTYSILTIGEGLVSQIPALLISISAGMVVTRVASQDVNSNLGSDVATQLVAKPKAIAIAAGLLTILALIPGLPKIPFFLLAAITGFTAYGLFRAVEITKKKTAQEGATAELVKGPELRMTVPLVLQVSSDLAPFVDLTTPEGARFYETVTQVRNGLYYETGVIFPSIQVSTNPNAPGGAYQIWLSEVPISTAQIKLNALLVNASAKSIGVFGFKAEEARNPATGKPAAWISREMRARAEAAGLQVWDTHEILILHLTAFLKKNGKEFVGLTEVQWMVSQLKRFYPALVDEVVPKPVATQTLVQILQRLVDEGVSIRDLKTIFQTLSQVARGDTEVARLTEHVRVALKRKICFQLCEGRPVLYVYQLDPDIVDLFRNSVRQRASGPQLVLDAQSARQITEAVRAKIGDLPPTAQRPVIVTDADVRRFVKETLDYHFPDVSVLSYDQLSPQIKIQPLGMVGMPAQAAVGQGSSSAELH
jgi:type III secretion protein V